MRRGVIVALAAWAWVLALTAASCEPPEQVPNGDLEFVQHGKPECFVPVGWGDHTAQWAMTSDAHSGSVAEAVTVTNHVSGDAKLITAENVACSPAVTPGRRYALSIFYKSTSPTNTLTVFRHSAAGWTFWTDLEAQPATDSWREARAITPPVPAGTDQLSFGLSIGANGRLVTDDYSIALVEEPPPPPEGELTYNGELEQGGDPPDGWVVAGWGDAQVNARVTAEAHAGARAFAVTLAGRTEGDFKLLPTEARAPAVQPGEIHRLSVWYRATSAANAITVFTHTASGWGHWIDAMTLAAADDWTKATVDLPAIPAGVDAIAWGVSLAGNGTLWTDDYSTTLVDRAQPPPGSGPDVEGRWSVLDYEMPIRSMHATVLENGKVLLIAGSGNDVAKFNAGEFKASIWDPIVGTFETLPVPKDMFCSGHVTLPDGRVLIQGGTKSYPSTAGGADYGGLKDSWLFDPDTKTFTPAANANDGHWYPTLTELGNGDIWMGGGLQEDTTGSVATELWSSSAGQWLPLGQVPQTWSFWGLYPHMFLMADGRLFYSGGHVFGNGLPGTGASIYDWQAPGITDVAGLREKDLRDQSASFLLPPAQDQRVLITGGGNINSNLPGIKLTDIIDLKQPIPAYQPGPDLPGEGKMYLNATILPDRKVLVSNGGRFNRDASANVLTAATYDPAANTWTPMAADPIGRNYHSTAVLLPDGRVAVLGSNPGDGSYELRISIYEPPYLFKTARPQISGLPAHAAYGQQLSFDVSSQNTIRWAQLMRPMSVTHQMDSNMRLVDLPVVVEDGVATVTLPSNPNLLPPGPYMLNVTDSAGVPSTSAWVSVR